MNITMKCPLSVASWKKLLTCCRRFDAAEAVAFFVFRGCAAIPRFLKAVNPHSLMPYCDNVLERAT